MIQYQILFVVIFLISLYLMKLLSWLISPRSEKCSLFRFFFFSPYPSVRSEKFQSPIRHYSILAALIINSMLMGIFLVCGWKFLTPLNHWKTILIAPAIYFFTEAIGALGQLLFSWRNQSIFPIHHHPLTSPSLSQFWGRRWNLWIQDWLKDISQALGRRPRIVRIAFTFFISGLFHEVMVNLPYWIYTGQSYFGTMILYFIIQAFGVFIDKKFLKNTGYWPRVLFQWMIVALPSPLFVNLPLLTFFGVTNPFR